MLKYFLIWEGDMAAAGVSPCGILSKEHLLATALCLVFLCLALYFSRNLSFRHLTRITRIIAIFVAALECCKIAFNLANGGLAPKHWLPLSFCSFAILSYFMLGFGRGRVRKLGLAFAAGGGIVGGFAFLVYPMTSVATYPMLHFLSCYSMLYHTVMMYVGLVYVQNGFFRYTSRTYRQYLLFTAPAALLALAVNIGYSFFGALEECNMMFLSHPSLLPNALPFVGTLFAAAPLLYTLSVLAVYLTVPYVLPLLVFRLSLHPRRPAPTLDLSLPTPEMALSPDPLLCEGETTAKTV